MRRRPAAITRCVADRYHARGERIVELSWPDGTGCLLSLRVLADGRPILDIYRADPKLLVSWKVEGGRKGKRGRS